MNFKLPALALLATISLPAVAGFTVEYMEPKMSEEIEESSSQSSRKYK